MGGMACVWSGYHAVLAVKDECGDALAACGGLRSLTAARAVIPGPRAIPPEIRRPIMTRHSLWIRDAEADVLREATHEEIIRAARSCLARRVVKGAVLQSPGATRDFILVELSERSHESFCVLYLDNRHRVLSWQEIFRGTIDGASVYPREVVKEAISRRAAACILVHNHPSGVAEPSQADELITRRLRDAMALVDIRILDHLIVAGTTVLSMAERGML